MKKVYILIPALATIALLLPIILDPSKYLLRNNDLQEFFWPTIAFAKNSLLSHMSFPLWNPMWLSGTPFISDPQAQMFYLPNLIFLVSDLDSGFVISLFFHTFFAFLGFFIFSSSVFKFSKTSSTIAASFYIFNSNFASIIEAGHYGIISSWAIIPWLYLAFFKIFKEKNYFWAMIAGLLASQMFLSHLITFLVALIPIFFYSLYYLLKNRQETTSIKLISMLLLSGAFAFGFSAIALLPQASWGSETTRFILTQKPEVFPVWTSIWEFIKAIVFPWKDNISTDKSISLGILPSLIFLFWMLKSRKRLLLGFVSLLALLFVSNNLNPLYEMLLGMNWYALLRVTTRIWVLVVILISLVLADITQKRSLPILLILFAVFESFLIAQKVLLKPVLPIDRAPEKIISIIKEDKETPFRVFCTTRCISQKEVSINNLETVEGYNTIQQKNYYQNAWQLTNSFWDYYTLAIPPIGLYKNENIQPDFQALGEYNTKYIIAPYTIDSDFAEEIISDGKYHLYFNKFFKKRSNVIFDEVKPGEVKFNNELDENIIYRAVFAKDWKAYNLQTGEELAVLETPNGLIQIEKSQKSDVKLLYFPKSFELGRNISVVTVIFAILACARKLKKRNI